MADKYVTELLDEYHQHKLIRSPWEDTWQEIAENIIPSLTGFLTDTPEKGTRRDERIVDGSAMAALQTYKAGIMGRLLSQYFNWFSIRCPDEKLMDVREVRMWLSEVDQAIYALIARSNFYPVMFQFFGYGGAIGTATIYREWDSVNQKEIFLCLNPREIYVAEDQYHDVDTVFRSTMMTYKQIAQAFKEDTIHPNVEKYAYDPQQQYHETEVIHVVKPNPDWNPRKKDKKSKRYKSCYVDVANETVMREGGYNVMPYCVWRVEKEPDEVYGRGPGWRALADVKGLYAYAKTNITGAQMEVNPPLQIPEEMRGRVKWVPAGHNYYDDTQRLIHEGSVNRNLQAGLEREARKQQIIEKHFMVPFFTMLQAINEQGKGDKTAYEVRRIEEEMAILLGPHITGLNQDVMDRLIDGMFNDAWDAGMIGQPPMALLKSRVATRLQVDYMGPLAQSQRSYYHSEPYRKTLSDLASIPSVDPTGQTTQQVMQNYDWDAFFRNMSKSNGLPEEVMIEELKRDKMRQAIAKQMEEQRRMAALEAAGRANTGLSRGPEPGSPAEQLNGGAP